jgi:methionyl-tRNA formyltransferase
LQVSKFASSVPGEILEASKEGIVVSTGRGNISIKELQIAGKRRMRAEEFISGHKISAGEVLTYPRQFPYVDTEEIGED